MKWFWKIVIGAGRVIPARYFVVSVTPPGVIYVSSVDRSMAMDICSSLNEDEMLAGSNWRWEVIYGRDA